MDIPMQASVVCKDQDCGQVVCVIMDPRNDDLTHIVVEESGKTSKERLVPVKYILGTDPKSIQLSLSKDELGEMEDFIEHRFIPSDQAYGVFPIRQRIYIPYTTIGEKLADVSRERIPSGGISFHAGAIVQATDGEIGIVEEFLVDPISEQISHMVVQTGHLWNKKEIAIPASEINRVEKDIVHLKLTRSQVEALPSPETLMQKSSMK